MDIRYIQLTHSYGLNKLFIHTLIYDYTLHEFLLKNNIPIEQIALWSTCSVVVDTEEVDVIVVDDDESAPGVGGDAIDCASKCFNCKPMLGLYK